MHLDWWTLGLQAINLLVLIWILSRFFFRPIARTISDRQAASNRLLDEAEKERESAKADRKKIAEAEAKTAGERSGILRDARDAAEKNKREMIARAREEIEKMRSDAKEDIALMRERGEAEIERKSIELAISITEKLFDRLPEAARITGFVDGLIDSLTKLPKATLDELRESDIPATIKVARALSDEEQKACCRALVPILGRDRLPKFVVDGSLIAGLALESPHVVIANNFRTDLDHIAEALTDDEKP